MPNHPRVIQFRLSGPEWDPLFAYADAHGVSVPAAARELLLASLATNAHDAVFIATAKVARHRMTKIGFNAMKRAMDMAYEEMKAHALAHGVVIGEDRDEDDR